jgi:hypothetical protein
MDFGTIIGGALFLCVLGFVVWQIVKKVMK